jgi:hypothetical protein
MPMARRKQLPVAMPTFQEQIAPSTTVVRLERPVPGHVADSRTQPGPTAADGRPLSVVKHGPRLLDQVKMAMRTRHMSPRTEEAYVSWIRRFIIFHGKRHPREMGEPEVTGFLSHLATHQHVSASTQFRGDPYARLRRID